MEFHPGHHFAAGQRTLTRCPVCRRDSLWRSDTMGANKATSSQHIMYQNPTDPDERNAEWLGWKEVHQPPGSAPDNLPSTSRCWQRQPGTSTSALHYTSTTVVHHGCPRVLPAEPHRPQGRAGALPETGAPLPVGQLRSLLETAGLKVPFETPAASRSIAQQMTDWLGSPSSLISL